MYSLKTPFHSLLEKNLLYRADCRDATKHLIENNITVDLVYLDPPFNSNPTYNLIFKSKEGTAQQKAFHDSWTLTRQNRQRLLDFDEVIDNNEDISPLLRDFLKVWLKPLKEGKLQDNKMLIYLVYMTERLVLLKKVLKDTGSLYLHCDPTASHYLKIVMDGVFGRENFRNEIVWHYPSMSRTLKDFPRKHDTILRYTLGSDYVFNYKDILVPYAKSSIARAKYKHVWNRGEGPSWNLKEGKVPDTVWQIPHIKSRKERLGYPTQKPLTLLERIVKASCPEDGVVYDPFCGCGTTLHSATLHKRQWIGCDISTQAFDVIKDRLEKLHVLEGKQYLCIEGSPETKNEYNRLNPYEKQDWLINQVGGFPNPRKSGDGGVDGEMTIHLGLDKDKKDLWGKMVFSVKTGKQSNPNMVRELVGTMKTQNAVMGGLILDSHPSENMVALAEKQGKITYQFSKDMPPQEFHVLQIITSDDVIDKRGFATPHSLKDIKLHRYKQGDMLAQQGL